jgi:hypothetical protein
MMLDRRQEIAGSTIVQKKYSLPDSPQWRRTKFVPDADTGETP